jgi:hypothetical protein
MPPSYGVDRNVTGDILPWDAVATRLVEARNYWVCTTRPDGRPHAMPVWGLWFEGAFWFATDAASRKARNLAGNPEAVVHLESGDEVTVLEGICETEGEPEVLSRFAAAYRAKYAIDLDFVAMGAAVYRLRLRRAFAWREQDFPTSATRWTA